MKTTPTFFLTLASLSASLTLLSCDKKDPTLPPPQNVSAISEVNIGTAPAPRKPGILPGAAEMTAVRESCLVTAIDKSTRTLTLKHKDGTLFTYQVSPKIDNFDDIRVGDTVTATVVEELGVFFRNAGLPPAEGESETIAVPIKGAEGFVYVDVVVVVANVLSIDLKNHTVTYATVDGKTQTSKIRPQVDLSAVQPGDDIIMRRTENLAILIEKTPTAPK